MCGPVLEAMLESPTCRISTVNGGKAMRDFLDANGPIDLVVLDGDMAGEKSASLALYLKELRIRLVMSSGSPAIMEFAKDERTKGILRLVHLLVGNADGLQNQSITTT